MQFIYLYFFNNKDNLDFVLSTLNMINSLVSHIG